MVETEASSLTITGVLSQDDDDDILHHVAYFFRKHFPAKINYKIYNKEYLAII
jgi:hypothetical protein